MANNFVQVRWVCYASFCSRKPGRNDVYWQPYIDGQATFEDAIAHLVSAV